MNAEQAQLNICHSEIRPWKDYFLNSYGSVCKAEQVIWFPHFQYCQRFLWKLEAMTNYFRTLKLASQTFNFSFQTYQATNHQVYAKDRWILRFILWRIICLDFVPNYSTQVYAMGKQCNWSQIDNYFFPILLQWLSNGEKKNLKV